MIVPFGDEAMLVVLGDEIEPGLNERTHALARAIEDERRRDATSAWGVPVPGYASVLAPFDADGSSSEAAAARLEAMVATVQHATIPETGGGAEHGSETREIAVRYGGEDGPDLLAVAERTGLTEAQVVDAHASTMYRVYLLGFVPGFAYLGTLPDELVLPRRDEPRVRIPAGSVAIAGRQTAVYPSETPGGWHLIGRTDVAMWDIDRDPPAFLSVGDRVRFVPQRDR